MIDFCHERSYVTACRRREPNAPERVRVLKSLPVHLFQRRVNHPEIVGGRAFSIGLASFFVDVTGLPPIAISSTVAFARQPGPGLIVPLSDHSPHLNMLPGTDSHCIWMPGAVSVDRFLSPQSWQK